MILPKPRTKLEQNSGNKVQLWAPNLILLAQMCIFPSHQMPDGEHLAEDVLLLAMDTVIKPK